MNISQLFWMLAALILLFIYIRLKRKHFLLEKEKNALIQEKEVVVCFLQDIGEAFTEAMELDDLLKKIINCSINLVGASAGAIFLSDPQRKYLVAKIVEGIFPPMTNNIGLVADKVSTKTKYLEDILKKEKIEYGHSVIGEAAKKEVPILVEDGDKDDRVPKLKSDILRIRTMMAVPLKIKNEVIGVMAIVNKWSGRFTSTDLSLFSSLADQASVSINNARFYHSLAEKNRIDRDLEIAKDIQQLLIPEKCPDISGYQVASYSKAALELGGDYYDFINVDEDHLGIVIADVSGKGISAAIVMATFRGMLNIIARGNKSPKSVLSEINRIMYSDMKKDMFISVLYLILNTKDHSIVASRAGHEPILLIHDQGRKHKLIKGNGIVIGIDEGDIFDKNLEETSINLLKDDIIVLYTDGITEAMDMQRREFGRENLIDSVMVSSAENAENIAKNIEDRIARFTGGVEQHDDITLLVLKKV